MKCTFLFLTLFFTSKAFSQSNEFQVYQLDTKEVINACSVIAYLDNIDLDAGYIEKISGSTITMRLAQNTDYLIQINDAKYFKIYGSNTDAISTLPKVALVNDPALVYKIQLGAFSKKIPSFYYSEFKDLVSEKKEGTIMTRLMTGNFNSFDEVKTIKEQIQNKGFKDAHIVAYYNGERIEFAEAQKIEARVKQVENYELTMLNTNSNKPTNDQTTEVN